MHLRSERGTTFEVCNRKIRIIDLLKSLMTSSSPASRTASWFRCSTDTRERTLARFLTHAVKKAFSSTSTTSLSTRKVEGSKINAKSHWNAVKFFVPSPSCVSLFLPSAIKVEAHYLTHNTVCYLKHKENMAASISAHKTHNTSPSRCRQP